MIMFFEETTSEIISEVSSTLEEGGSSLSKWNWEEIFHNIVNWCKTDGLRFLIALIVLIVLFLIINGIAKGIRSNLRRHHKDEIICNAVYNVIRKALKLVVLILFLGYIGIDMAGVSSIIASCAVALGLALQGSLSNVAGWFMIVLIRPFKLGDFISCQGEAGTVEDINLFYTHLKTPDNKVILIPNGNLTSGNITNFSKKDIRRIDLVFPISYKDDSKLAIETIKKTISKNNMIFTNPEPFVRVSNYSNSSVDITVRVWSKSDDYWTIYFDLMDSIRKDLEASGCTIPYNQLDVNISYNNKENNINEEK